jgi:hypothetical protein
VAAAYYNSVKNVDKTSAINTIEVQRISPAAIGNIRQAYYRDQYPAGNNLQGFFTLNWAGFRC